MVRALLFALSVVLAMATFSDASAESDRAGSFTQVKQAYVSSEARLLDRHGEPLSELRIDHHVRRLDWVPLVDISPPLSAALIATEDKRFFEHHGVDWPGLAAAAWDSVWRTLDGRRVRGGSTLTMQLAGFLDPALASSAGTRTLAQKWDQAKAALAIEREWSKPQILEAYLNLASFRGELKGLHAAARGLFGKDPAGLDAREAAILVALLRGPGAASAVVAQRACSVALVASPNVPCSEIRDLTAATFANAYRLPPRWNLAPHLAAKLLKDPGQQVTSTLDAGLQRDATRLLHDHLGELAEHGVEDAAVLVLDNASGEVLAYVGSSGTLSGASAVDGVVASRQAGSTLKPFLYALALDSKLLTAASLVDDSPLSIATERGIYAPQNYDRHFHGLVSVRTALANSLNVPAVRTLGLVGLDPFYAILRRVGLDTLTEDSEHYGSSLALGGADVNLLALANAYRVLANGGVFSSPRVIQSTSWPATQRAFGAEASFIVADILADRGARAITFGLDNPLATRVWSAVKTGTSKDMRDNWCVGFTARYTVGVWVGNFSGAPMHDVSGVTGAAPLWRDIVHRLHETGSNAAPAAPRSVLRMEVAFDPAVEPPRHEWFIPGTEMAIVRSGTGGTLATPRIRYPVADAIIAVDPDIPEGRQRVVFEAAPVVPGLQWRLDGSVIPDVRGRVAWTPQRGRHALALEDASGQSLSRIAFEVR